MARDTSSGHPRIPIASMDLSDPVPCQATPSAFCRRSLCSLPQPNLASLNGMSPHDLVASMDTDGSDFIPGYRGTHDPASRHVTFSPMSEDERLLSMTTVPPDFSPLPPACEAEPMVACMHSGGVTAYNQAPAQKARIHDTRQQHRTYHCPEPHVVSLGSMSPPRDRRVLVASINVGEPHPGPHRYVAPLDGSSPRAPQVLIVSMDTDTTHRSPQPYVASLDGSCPTAPQVLIASMDIDTTHRSPEPYVASLDRTCPAARPVLVASMHVDTPGRGLVPGAGPQPHVDSVDETVDNGPRVLVAPR